MIKEIYIGIKKLDNAIKIIIKDDGIGMDEKTVQKFNNKLNDGMFSTEQGIGIENVRKIINIYYKDNYEWSLSSKMGEGTLIKIILHKGRT